MPAFSVSLQRYRLQEEYLVGWNSNSWQGSQGILRNVYSASNIVLVPIIDALRPARKTHVPHTIIGFLPIIRISSCR